MSAAVNAAMKAARGRSTGVSPVSGGTRARRPCYAFTLMEVLVAVLFLGILVPVIIESVNIGIRASVVAERSAIAAELGQSKLGELLINDDWAAAETSGDFGDDWKNYRWELTQTTWEANSAMTALEMKVYYPAQGQERHITLTTLVSGSSSTAGSTTAGGSGSSGPNASN